MLKKAVEYLRKNRFTTLSEITSYLGVDESAVLPMLDILIRKDYLKKADNICRGCGSDCRDCLFSRKETYYIWDFD